MPRYSDFIDRVLLAPDLLAKLHPGGPLDYDLSRRLRETDDATLAGGAIGDVGAFALVRGAVLYALDELDAAHRIFQDDSSSLGSYWHGMMHRREADFDNARYWFRCTGRLGVFGRLHELARDASRDMAKQPTWDPYLFTGQCEQAKFGATELIPECVALQRAEFAGMLAHCWEKAAIT